MMYFEKHTIIINISVETTGASLQDITETEKPSQDHFKTLINYTVLQMNIKPQKMKIQKELCWSLIRDRIHINVINHTEPIIKCNEAPQPTGTQER